jgi:hypothetical protein
LIFDSVDGKEYGKDKIASDNVDNDRYFHCINDKKRHPHLKGDKDNVSCFKQLLSWLYAFINI